MHPRIAEFRAHAESRERCRRCKRTFMQYINTLQLNSQATLSGIASGKSRSTASRAADSSEASEECCCGGQRDSDPLRRRISACLRVVAAKGGSANSRYSQSGSCATQVCYVRLPVFCAIFFCSASSEVSCAFMAEIAVQQKLQTL